MSTNASVVQVTATAPSVVIAGCNAVNGWPDAAGIGTRLIGTASGHVRSINLDVASLAANERRLANELADLVTGAAVAVTIDGVTMTAAKLRQISSVASVEEPVQIPVEPHNNWEGISGTWTEVYNDTTHLYRVDRTAAAATHLVVLDIPAQALRNLADSGFKPTGFELIYQVAAEVANEVDVAVFKTSSPANGVAKAATTMSTGQTYDAAHDTAAERGAIGSHTMVVTLDPALAAVDFLNDGETVHVELTVNDTTGGGATFTLWGWALLGVKRASGPAS